MAHLLDNDIPEYSGPVAIVDDDAKLHEVIERIIDDEFFLMCI